MKKIPSQISQPKVLAMALFSVLGSTNLYADSTENIQLDTVEVTGNRLSSNNNNVTAEQIDQLQANNLADLFERSPEVNVGGGLDIAQRIYVRGIEDTLLNISIDGATQSGRLFHHIGRISIEPELLKQVDVQAGTGNALSGPGALGGAIKFVTKDPVDMLKPGQKYGALVKGMYSSNTDSFKTNTSIYGHLNDDWSAMLSYTRFDQDEYEDGNGDDVIGTQSDQDFIFAKLVGHLTDSQTFRFSYEKRTDEGDRLQRPQWRYSSDYNLIYPLKMERQTFTANYVLDPIDNDFINLSMTVFHTDSELEQNVIGRWGQYFGDATSDGIDIRNTSEIGINTLTYGVDYRRDKTTAGYAADKDELEETTKVKGVYIQDDIQLTKQLLLSTGARYDSYKLHDNNDMDIDDDHISPNVSLSYQASDNINLHASYTEAFRGPISQDAFKLEGSEKDPNLKPEEANSYEFGVAYDSLSWFGSAKVYKTNIDDLISTVGRRPAVYTNVGDLESKGYVLEIGHRWDSLQASLSYHHNDAEVDDLDANVYDHGGFATSIGNTWTANVDYKLDQAWSLGWTGKFVERRDNIETSQGEIDKSGYGIHALYAVWQPTEYPNLKVNLAINNIFDKQYLDHASNGDFSRFTTPTDDWSYIIGLPEPGRDVRLSVAWQF